MAATKTTVVQVPGISKLSKADLSALNTAAKAIGVPVDWLATVISFETGGTFSPSVLNRAGSGAFGLIQFMPSTAQALLKTATAQEAVAKGMAMSFAQQLKEMVIPYFKGGTYKDLHALYLHVFYPAAANKSDDYIVGSAPGAVYTQNKGLDIGGKGYITRADITSTISGVYNRAAALPPIVIEAASILSIIFGVALAVGIVVFTEKKTSILDLPRGWL
jgi:hypothetical protein